MARIFLAEMNGRALILFPVLIEFLEFLALRKLIFIYAVSYEKK